MPMSSVASSASRNVSKYQPLAKNPKKVAKLAHLYLRIHDHLFMASSQHIYQRLECQNAIRTLAFGGSIDDDPLLNETGRAHIYTALEILDVRPPPRNMTPCLACTERKVKVCVTHNAFLGIDHDFYLSATSRSIHWSAIDALSETSTARYVSDICSMKTTD